VAATAVGPDFDALAYRGRNVVERSFNQIKDWRGLATRYESSP
jgi:transposase